MRCDLSIHGLRVAVDGDWPEVVDWIREDWAWFAAPPTGPAQVRVEVVRREPDLGALGPLEASFVTPRNVVYHDRGRTVVDYFGSALTVVDPGGSARVEGLDPQLVREAAWHYLLSRTGAHVESQGRPRIHALAVSGAQGAVAILFPGGGGKTTLALRALADDRVRLLSDDMPLLDRRGWLHPFPLGISVNATDVARLPAGVRARRVERMEFHGRLLLPVESFRDRIDPEPRPLAHLVLGRRTLAPGATLVPERRAAAAGPLLRQAVIGVDLFQGMEFLLRRGPGEALGRVRPAAARTASCAAALRRARVWTLRTGLDGARNWEALAPLFAAPGDGAVGPVGVRAD